MFSSIDFSRGSQEVKRKKMKINQIDKSETKQGGCRSFRLIQQLISKITKCVDKFLTVIIKVLRYQAMKSKTIENEC